MLAAVPGLLTTVILAAWESRGESPVVVVDFTESTDAPDVTVEPRHVWETRRVAHNIAANLKLRFDRPSFRRDKNFSLLIRELSPSVLGKASSILVHVLRCVFPEDMDNGGGEASQHLGVTLASTSGNSV